MIELYSSFTFKGKRIGIATKSKLIVVYLPKLKFRRFVPIKVSLFFDDTSSRGCTKCEMTCLINTKNMGSGLSCQIFRLISFNDWYFKAQDEHISHKPNLFLVSIIKTKLK